VDEGWGWPPLVLEGWDGGTIEEMGPLPTWQVFSQPVQAEPATLVVPPE
jgi:hypothetical protein